MGFEEWCRRVRRCAEIFRRGGTTREARRVADGVMRHAYALVCAVMHEPSLDITEEDYETYYAAQLKRTRKYNSGADRRVHNLSNENLLRIGERPAFCSPARWRMHMAWRKNREHYRRLSPDA